ncbi:MAG: aspartyl protease-like protein [Deltaproteobacteria bacterium]|nr:aspartyl protease-like protein [Deltaproteobacteria bacterium]
MTIHLTRLRIAALVLAGSLACGNPAPVQSQSDAEIIREPSQVRLLTAPDETSPAAAVVARDEVVLSPTAQVLGPGGVKWYLVKTKNGVVGWITAGDVDAGSRLERVFKSIPAELSISSLAELPSSGANSAPANAIVVPIQTNGSSVIVPVVLNRTVQTNMILDTGASFTVVSHQLAGRLGLKSTRRVSLVTANGTVGAPMAPLGSLKVGDAEAANLTVVIQDFSTIPTLGGLLGLDFLSRYHTSIDSRRQLLILAPR